MNIPIGVITAPRRPSYLVDTLGYLPGGLDVSIFMEPGCKLFPGHKEYKKIHNPEKYGCVKNWFESLRRLDVYTSTWVCLIEDDVQWRPGLWDGVQNFLNTVKPEDTGIVSPYCSQRNRFKNKVGWQEARMPGHGWCGACTIFMPNTTREMILDNEALFYQKATENTKSKQPLHLDYAIGALCQINGLKIYTHAPTLVWHRGEVSTFEANNRPEARNHYARQPAT